VISRYLALLAVALMVGIGSMYAYQWWAKSGVEDPFVLRPDDPAVVSAGKIVYQENCASCHGANLEGEPNWRSRKLSGKLPAPPHDETGHTWHHADRVLVDLTKYGPQLVAGPDYQSDMPAFEGVIPDEDIIAALSYIKSTWNKRERETQDEITRRTVLQ
jgi:mono/diheme cytochrome c family protein